MATALDVAAYILAKAGPMTAMKLQKLVYYSQAWHLVWTDGEPMFEERVEAWANGPVVRELYDAHRGRLRLSAGEIPGEPKNLMPGERDSVDEVLDSYGSKTAQWLSELTHQEAPWRDARQRANLSEFDRGNAVIPQSAMYEYYLSLTTTNSEQV